MPTASYSTVVKIAGTSTAMVAEPTTDGGAHTIYQITDTTKRVLDPDTAVVVDKDGAPASSADYTLDYMFGKVTFAVALGAEIVVTFDASYLPLLEVTTAHEVDFQVTNELRDTTQYADDGERTRTPCLQDLSGTLAVYEDGTTDHDTGDDAATLEEIHEASTASLLEILFGGSTEYLRAWVHFGSMEVGGALADVVQTRFPWTAAGRSPAPPFSYGS